MAEMRYPYTLGAQLMQFPWKKFYKQNWVIRSWVNGIVLALPIMAVITKSIPEPAPKKSDH
uniref:Uncharacterized protein n=1 Tax=Acartia pacifica TaxID=335913 RepID=A0A0U2TJZ3_ACAPC|nr:hypothetical protein YQE_10512 [Acartia pacifica]ALS04505.1 hypothetical protein [Acartia pacifica]